MPENMSGLKDALSPSMYRITPLSDSVSRVAIKNTGSRMFLCTPWEGILLWANKVENRYLPYGDTEFGGHFASLNYCISGRCEVCLPDDTYIYMEPGMLCIDDHKPKDGYWYPGQSYSGLEVVFDLDMLLEHPIPELTAYCDYDGWVREKLHRHDGTYLATAGNECDRLMNLLCSHLVAADWKLEDYRLHLLLLFYSLAGAGTVPVMDRFYVTKGQKHIADEVEQLITKDLSCHYTIADMAAMYGISPSALKKYFETVYGLPVSFYLREKRIMLAKSRLSETKDSVSVIAAACGYSNQGKFGSVFRECTGMSPLEYRRLNYGKKEEGGNNDKFK